MSQQVASSSSWFPALEASSIVAFTSLVNQIHPITSPASAFTCSILSATALYTTNEAPTLLKIAALATSILLPSIFPKSLITPIPPRITLQFTAIAILTKITLYACLKLGTFFTQNSEEEPTPRLEEPKAPKPEIPQLPSPSPPLIPSDPEPSQNSTALKTILFALAAFATAAAYFAFPAPSLFIPSCPDLCPAVFSPLGLPDSASFMPHLPSNESLFPSPEPTDSTLYLPIGNITETPNPPTETPSSAEYNNQTQSDFWASPVSSSWFPIKEFILVTVSGVVGYFLKKPKIIRVYRGNKPETNHKLQRELSSNRAPSTTDDLADLKALLPQQTEYDAAIENILKWLPEEKGNSLLEELDLTPRESKPLDQLGTKIKKFLDKFDSLQKNMSNLKEINKSFENEIDEQKNFIENLQKKINALEKEVQNLRLEKAKSETTISHDIRSSSQLLNASSIYDQLKEQIKDLKQKLEDSKTESEKNKQTFQTIKNYNHELKEKNNELYIKTNNQETEIMNLNTNIRKLLEHKQALKSELESLNEKNDKLNGSFDLNQKDYEQTLEELNKKITKKNEKIAQLEEGFAQLKIEYDGFKKEIQELVAPVTPLSESVLAYLNSPTNPLNGTSLDSLSPIEKPSPIKYN